MCRPPVQPGAHVLHTGGGRDDPNVTDRQDERTRQRKSAQRRGDAEDREYIRQRADERADEEKRASENMSAILRGARRYALRKETRARTGRPLDAIDVGRFRAALRGLLDSPDFA